MNFWTDEEIQKLIEYKQVGLSHHEISKKLDRSYYAIKRKWALINTKNNFNFNSTIEKKSKTTKISEERKKKFNLEWDKIKKQAEKYQDPYTWKQIGIIRNSRKRIKTVISGDHHIPFCRFDLVQDLVKKHSGSELLILNGDILDEYAISTFIKEKFIAFKEEYDMALDHIAYLSKHFKKILLISGNHDQRFNKYINKTMDPSISWIIDKEVLGRLARGEIYEDGEVIGHKGYDNVIFNKGMESWFVKLGDAIIIHPKNFSQIPSKVALAVRNHFIERTDINCCVIGHTHKNSFFVNKGTLCIESGCMCIPLEYEKRGKLGMTPQILGYTELYQDLDGNTDFNMTRNEYLGEQYPKTDDLMDQIELKGGFYDK